MGLRAPGGGGDCVRGGLCPTPTPKLRKGWGPAVWPATSARVGWSSHRSAPTASLLGSGAGTLRCSLSFLLSFSQLPGSGTLLVFANLFVPPSNKRIYRQDRGACAGLPPVLPAEHTRGRSARAGSASPARTCPPHLRACRVPVRVPCWPRGHTQGLSLRPLTAPLPLLWASEVPLTAHPGDSTRSWPSEPTRPREPPPTPSLAGPLASGWARGWVEAR